MESFARLLRGVGDADEGQAEVSLHINGEGFDRGDVEDAAALFFGGRRGKHEAVEAPEEGGEGFAGAGGCAEEGGFAPGDWFPAEELGAGGRVEDGVEPGADRRMKFG